MRRRGVAARRAQGGYTRYQTRFRGHSQATSIKSEVNVQGPFMHCYPIFLMTLSVICLLLCMNANVNVFAITWFESENERIVYAQNLEIIFGIEFEKTAFKCKLNVLLLLSIDSLLSADTIPFDLSQWTSSEYCKAYSLDTETPVLYSSLSISTARVSQNIVDVFIQC